MELKIVEGKVAELAVVVSNNGKHRHSSHCISIIVKVKLLDIVVVYVKVKDV